MKDKKNNLETDIEEILNSIIPCQICRYADRENYKSPCRRCHAEQSYCGFYLKKGAIIKLAGNLEKYIFDNYEQYAHEWRE